MADDQPVAAQDNSTNGYHDDAFSAEIMEGAQAAVADILVGPPASQKRGPVDLIEMPPFTPDDYDSWLRGRHTHTQGQQIIVMLGMHEYAQNKGRFKDLRHLAGHVFAAIAGADGVPREQYLEGVIAEERMQRRGRMGRGMDAVRSYFGGDGEG